MPPPQYSNSEGQCNIRGSSDIPQLGSQTHRKRQLHSPLSSESRQRRLVVCETEEGAYKCAEGGWQVSLPEEGGASLLKNIWTIYDNAQGAGKPKGANSLSPPPGRRAAEQARRGEAGEPSACEASVARGPAPRPIPRMW